MALISRTRRLSGRDGFSLYELTIAIGVLMVGILVALQSQVSSTHLVQTTHETDTATSDLQSAMERILLLSPDHIPVAGSAFEAGTPIAAFSDLHLHNERIVPTYPGYGGGAVVPDPLQIQLTLTWNDFQGRQRTMQIACTRTR
jgi:type II secretory pathway pseudopilin PulG